MDKKISRRKFLVLASLTGSAAVLSACGQPTQAPVQATQPPQPTVEQPTNTPAATSAPTATTAPVATITPTKPATPTTLNIIHNWSPEDSHGPYMKDVFTRFMDANPDVTIKEDIVTDVDIAQKVNTAFMAGQEPDLIFDNDFPQTVLWPQQGVTISLDQYLKDWGLADAFLPSALATFTTNFGGKLAAFPLEGYYWLLFYNPRVFKAASVDIPTNVDELIAAVPKIKATGSEVLALALNDDSGYWGALVWKKAGMTNQEYWDWEAGKRMMADIPDARTAVAKFVQFRDAGGFPKNAAGLTMPDALQLFTTGKSAMYVNGTWICDAMVKAMPADLVKEIIVGGFPPFPGNPDLTKSVVEGSFGAKGIWITRNGAKKIDAVRRFIQFFYQNVNWITQNLGEPYPMKDSSKLDLTKLNPLSAQTLSWGDRVSISGYAITPSGVDLSAPSNLQYTSAPVDDIIAAYDKAYKEGMSK